MGVKRSCSLGPKSTSRGRGATATRWGEGGGAGEAEPAPAGPVSRGTEAGGAGAGEGDAGAGADNAAVRWRRVTTRASTWAAEAGVAGPCQRLSMSAVTLVSPGMCTTS